MAVTGYKASGTQANADRDGKKLWSNPANAGASDNSRASVWDLVALDYSDWLRLTNFGFAIGDVPAGSSIDGIEVQIERRANTDVDIRDSAIYLRNGAAAQAGDNKADVGTDWPVADAYATYGGAADTWNAGLTAADIIDADFGIDISAQNQHATNARNAQIDYVQIRIYYTLAASTTTSTSSSTSTSTSSSTSTSLSTTSSSTSTTSSSTTSTSVTLSSTSTTSTSTTTTVRPWFWRPYRGVLRRRLRSRI